MALVSYLEVRNEKRVLKECPELVGCIFVEHLECYACVYLEDYGVSVYVWGGGGQESYRSVGLNQLHKTRHKLGSSFRVQP